MVRGFVDAGTAGLADRQARYVRFANIWGLVLGMVVLPYTVVFTLLGAPVLGAVCLPLALFYFALPALNQRGHFPLVRSGIIVIGNAVVLLYAGFLGRETGLEQIFFCVAFVPMLLSHRGEWAFRTLGIATPVLSALVLRLWGDEVFPAPLLSPAMQQVLSFAMTPTVFALLIVAFVSFSVANEKGEEALAVRNDQMRTVLDSVEEALLIMDDRGRILGARSAAATTLLGVVESDDSLVDALRRSHPDVAIWLELGLSSVREDIMPIEVSLDQLPGRLTVAGRSLRLRYQPLRHTASFSLLIIATDETEAIARAQAEEQRQETAAAVEHLMRDRNGFMAFVDESDRLVEVVLSPDSPRIDVGRALHTLKGNATMFGLTSVGTAAHVLEDRFAADDGVERTHVEALGTAWLRARQRLGRLLGPAGGGAAIVLAEREHEAFLDAITAGAPREHLATVVKAWRYETGGLILDRVGSYASALARRLGKEVDVVIDDNGLRFASSTWAPLWSTMVHAVRNAVDHGLEPPDERIAQAKPSKGVLTLECRLEGDALVIAVADDGRGVNWSLLANKGRALGMDAHEVLFMDGVSSRDTVTDISGRGVGLGALRDACTDLGGTVEVRDGRAGGTVVEVRIPGARQVVCTTHLVERQVAINVSSPSLLAH
jgi:HPt (histidine-containing phosphotransfer) domain-containing protein